MAEDFRAELDRANERIFERTINGKDYRIRCTDPFGHWHVEVKTGRVPDVLSGSYTSTRQCWQEIEAYENARPKPVERTILSTDGKGGKKRIPLAPQE